jgi:hypothetical protein
VVMTIVEGVARVSEQAIAVVAGPAACEHDSDKEAVAVAPVMKGLGPGLVSLVRFPVNCNAKEPAWVVDCGTMPGAVNCSRLKVNVKVPPPLFVVGTATVMVGVPLLTGITNGLTTAVDPFVTNKFPVRPPVSCGTTKVFVVVAAVMLPVFTVTAPPGPANVNDPVAAIGAVYAVLLINAATSPAAPARLNPNFRISYSPHQLWPDGPIP